MIKAPDAGQLGAFVDEQRRRLAEALAAAQVARGPYVLLDYPDHPNIGDSAIWAGEAEFLAEYAGRPPAYVCTIGSYAEPELVRALPEGPILLHGGGNFGDIWKSHQDFRLKILETFRDRHVVQLSQTIQFNKAEELERAKRLIGEHSNFHLFVRDARSYELAQTHFQCATQLVPDFAFGMVKPLQRSSQRYDLVFLIRDDVESSNHDLSRIRDHPNGKLCDWPLDGRRRLSTVRRFTKLRGLASGWSPERIRLEDYNVAARWRVDRGTRILSEGRCVVTDRLHAHILATLLGLPNVVLDNNYGKVHGYRQQWTAAAGGSVPVSTLDEALTVLAKA